MGEGNGQKKTRLCIVTPAHWKAQPGGAEYQIDCILRELIPTDRYDVTYIARHVDPEFRPDGYRIVSVGTSGRHPRWGYLEDMWAVNKALREHQPHVIYQRVGCGYTGVCASYARRHGARMIWHVAHDTDVSHESLPDGRNPIRHRLEKLSLEYGLRRTQKIVTQTQAQSLLLDANYGREANRVVPNFHPLPLETIDKSGPLQVLWIANLKPWKRPEVFVRLANSLRDLTGVHFLMVGAAATGAGDRAWSQQLTASIEATPNLRYLGSLPQNKVNELLARAHLFVNTSVHEGFPNTFIQAWMREVPVASLSVDPDGVLERECVGRLSGTEDRLATWVRSMLTKPQLRKEYSLRAKTYAFAHHSPANVSLLRELIDSCARDAAVNVR